MSPKYTLTFNNNNPQSVFYAGSILSGTAAIITDEEKFVKELYITIDGSAKVLWRNRKKQRRSRGSSPFYSSEITYLSKRIVLLENQVLPADTYRYNFQTDLPTHLPTSLNGHYGQIKYQATLVITQSETKGKEILTKQLFTVISPLDLNMDPSIRTPIERTEQRILRYCCFNSSPLILQVRLPFSGFVPGQKLYFKIEAINNSWIDCQGIKITLERTFNFVSTTPREKRRFETTKILQKLLGTVPGQSVKEFNDYLELPSTPPTSLINCPVISVTYSLQIFAKTGSCNEDIKINIPITIGTVPLRLRAKPVTEQPKLTTNKSPEMYLEAFDKDPPSYEEATAENEKICENIFPDADKDDINFKPKYPVFHNLKIDNDT